MVRGKLAFTKESRALLQSPLEAGVPETLSSAVTLAEVMIGPTPNRERHQGLAPDWGCGDRNAGGAGISRTASSTVTATGRSSLSIWVDCALPSTVASRCRGPLYGESALFASRRVHPVYPKRPADRRRTARPRRPRRQRRVGGASGRDVGRRPRRRPHRVSGGGGTSAGAGGVRASACVGHGASAGLGVGATRRQLGVRR